MKYLPLVFLVLTGCAPNMFMSWRPRTMQTDQHSMSKINPTQSVILLGNRDYVESVLKQVFTPTGNETFLNAILKQQIRNKMGLFGGSCTNYTSEGLTDCTRDDALAVVAESDSLISNTQPTSAPREARRVNACVQITSLPEAVSAAVAKISGANAGARPASPQVASAFQLFYPGRAPDANVMRALSALSTWHDVLLALCSSPGWQIL